ncbi:hypothetical protein SUGI_0776910 [Cryptomeria japonica]|nr:hypothetical protein SUGI_0776910 [Cryptomeria japonica]
MVSISGLDVDAFIIDCNWYYGCLFSPKKKVDIDAIAIAEDESGLPSLAEKGAGNIKRLRENVCMEEANGEAECLASMFRVLDEDGDGRVSADEVMRFLKRLDLERPKEEVELTVRSVSACGEDFLTVMEFGEFYRLIYAYKEEGVDNGEDEEQVICGTFGVFDQNGDGFISAMELADVLCKLGFVEGSDVNCCQSMIKSVDHNGDGFVDIHEFKHLIYRTVFPPYL